MMAVNDVQNLVIVLIHGTFAKDALWTAPQSSFRRNMETLLKRPVRFEVFTWTGANSHQARLDAGEELTKFLHRTYAEVPEARVYLAGHSHGGNIALYALRDWELRAKVKGVITLGTPFIDAENWELGSPVGWISTLIEMVFLICLFIGLMIVFVAAFGLLSVYFHWDFPLDLLGGLVVAYICYRWVRRLRPWSSEHELDRNVERFFSPAIDARDISSCSLIRNTEGALPVLSIRYSLDEAGIWLTVVMWLSDLPHLFVFGFNRFVVLIGEIHENVPFFLYVFIYFSGLPFVLLYVTAAVILLPLVILVTTVVRARTWGFGRESWRESIAIRYRVLPFVRSPGVECRVFSVLRVVRRAGFRTTVAAILSGKMIHGLPYEEVESISAIVDWIEHREELVGAN